jgi:hypothetical protein
VISTKSFRNISSLLLRNVQSTSKLLRSKRHKITCQGKKVATHMDSPSVHRLIKGAERGILHQEIPGSY